MPRSANGQGEIRSKNLFHLDLLNEGLKWDEINDQTQNSPELVRRTSRINPIFDTANCGISHFRDSNDQLGEPSQMSG